MSLLFTFQHGPLVPEMRLRHSDEVALVPYSVFCPPRRGARRVNGLHCSLHFANFLTPQLELQHLLGPSPGPRPSL